MEEVLARLQQLQLTNTALCHKFFILSQLLLGSVGNKFGCLRMLRVSTSVDNVLVRARRMCPCGAMLLFAFEPALTSQPVDHTVMRPSAKYPPTLKAVNQAKTIDQSTVHQRFKQSVNEVDSAVMLRSRKHVLFCFSWHSPVHHFIKQSTNEPTNPSSNQPICNELDSTAMSPSRAIGLKTPLKQWFVF